MKPDGLLAAAETVVSKPSIANKYDNAADKLARHIQRMYDPTPVDREWWRSVAGGKVVYHRPLALEYRKKSIEFLHGYNTIAVMTTRGDVRRLCEVLGIELRGDA